MNKMAKLIKSKIISFLDCLIKYYKQIDLSEMDAMIIAKCYLLIQDGTKTLDVKRMTEGVNLNEAELNDHIFKLVENGYIDFAVKYGKEIIVLDGTIEKLGIILEARQSRDESNTNKTALQEMIYYYEKTFSKISSVNDLTYLNKWSKEFSVEDVKRSIDDAYRQGKMTSPYVDAILNNKKQHEEYKGEVDAEAKALLDTAYGKR